MKYAEKDNKGNITYTETSDRKKCLTYKEFLNFKNSTNFEKYSISYGTDTKYNLFNNKLVGYFWLTFKQYPEYIQDIGKLHEMYGRGVDVEVLRTRIDNVLELNVRAYNNFR